MQKKDQLKEPVQDIAASNCREAGGCTLNVAMVLWFALNIKALNNTAATIGCS